MRPLTASTPKPLLKVKGKALIEHHLLALQKAGLQDVVINTAYLGAQIERFIGDGTDWQLKVQYSREPKPLETAGAIQYACELLGENAFILVNADIYTDFAFENLRQMSLLSHQLAHLVLVNNPPHNPSGDFALSLDNNNELSFGGQGALTFSGISLINPAQFRQYQSEKVNYPLRDVLRWGCKQGSVSGQYFHGDWTDVGTPERLRELNA